MIDSDDDLLPLLTPRGGHGATDDAFIRSLRVLQSRARFHRAIKATALVAVLGLGIAVGWFVKPNRPAEQNSVPLHVEPIPLGGSSTYVELTPDQIEQKAELADDRGDAGKFYKLAGDAYLGRQRYDEAARCYRLHVKLNRETDLGKDDSWLLCSVKITSQKEIDR